MGNIVLEKYGREYNMMVKNNYMYGVKDNYYICTQYIMTGYVATTEICIPIVNLSEEGMQGILEFVKINKKSLKLISAEFRQNVVVIKTNAIPNTNKTHFTDALNEILSFFKESSFLSGCSLSQETSNIQFVFYKGAIIAVSQAIALQFEEASKQMDHDNETRGYLSGVVGASIGGIVGMIPWILFAMLGYVSAISGLAMGWLVKTGYDKSKAKKGGLQFAIIIAAIIVFTYLGIMASQTYFLVQLLMEEGYKFSDLSIFEMFKYIVALPFTSGPGVSEMREAIGQGYFFAALGSVFFLAKARKNKEFAAGDQIDTNIEQPINETAA